MKQTLRKHASFKKRCVKTNQAPFISKSINKEIIKQFRRNVNIALD